MLDNLEKPFIHLFSLSDEFYMYDVNTNKIVCISKEVYDYLNEEADCLTNEVYDIISSLKKQGFLLTNRMKRIEHPFTEKVEYYLQSKLQMLSLQVTQNCNLRCDYCAYSGNYTNRSHQNINMSFDSAKKAVDFFIDRSGETNQLGIGFYGGEPLLQFSLIKKTVSYILENYPEREYVFTITTNGTVMPPEAIAFLDNHNFGVMISLDGYKENHDKNRKFNSNGVGSFDTIIKNLKIIKDKYSKLYKNLTFSVVLDADSDFSKCNEFFINNEFVKDSILSVASVSNNYIKEEKENTSNRLELERYELFKYLLVKMNRLKIGSYSKLIWQYDSQLEKFCAEMAKPSDTVPENGHHSGPCIPGAHRLFVNVNGDFFPCEKVSECSEVCGIGNIENGFDIEKVKSILNIGKLTEDECKNCWAYRYCMLCLVHSDGMDKLSSKKKLSYCDNVRNSAEEKMKEYCFLKKMNSDKYEEVAR
ncbi:Cys-rich peptide radical SAM maturase CcpM [Paenibacillus donghaensis]|uniref:Cys-rich peptide radical SAM maturase CcpM n=1 Tax=Paenibacillus donghaensis TaxID=414771 RepID=A0A2Z2KGL7_9BACL|nr:Cys-rich peptide radical SAM maturase CcpM [Paenibacillus donghaensis]ASA25344.1 Cys-rich peptide radical SAM maturase CcpM [Paenibacillus donghaensis]